MTAPRALTGIQPSGVPHVGNLKGMIEPAVDLQSTHAPFYFIASYHALTSLHDPEAMRRNIHEVAMSWLAFGLDPERAALFRLDFGFSEEGLNFSAGFGLSF